MTGALPRANVCLDSRPNVSPDAPSDAPSDAPPDSRSDARPGYRPGAGPDALAAAQLEVSPDDCLDPVASPDAGEDLSDRANSAPSVDADDYTEIDPLRDVSGDEGGFDTSQVDEDAVESALGQAHDDELDLQATETQYAAPDALDALPARPFTDQTFPITTRDVVLKVLKQLEADGHLDPEPAALLENLVGTSEVTPIGQYVVTSH